MNKLLKYLFFIALIFIVVSVPVSAAPPVTTVQQFATGYVIEDAPQINLKQNENYQINFFVYNLSNALPISNASVNCVYYLANSSGEVIFYGNVNYFTADGHWGLDIRGGNFSYSGYYSYGIKCNSTSFGGVTTGYYEVSPTGDIRNYGFFLVLILFALILFVGGYLIDQDWLIFLSGMTWLIGGIYIMIYGIRDLTDLYTRSIAGVCWAIGVVFIIASIYNLSKAGGTSLGEEGDF